MSNGVKAAATTGSPVIKEMSFLDRWLAVWILLAMGIGLALGRFVPGLNTALDAMSIGGISLPIAIGLLVMMYPVLAKDRKSTRLNSSHVAISFGVLCVKKKSN